jgi:PAS domain S-box-containing protein
MLNSELRIRRYTPVAEKVLNLIPSDIGRPISDLKPRINVPDLEQLLATVVHSAKALEREVQDQNGRWYSLRIHPYRTAEDRIQGAVLQLLDINQLKLSMTELAAARDYAEAIIGTVREPLLVLDPLLNIQTANRAFFDTFRLAEKDIANRNLNDLDHGQWDIPKVKDLFDRLSKSRGDEVLDVELEQEFPRIGWRSFQLYARKVRNGETGDLTLLAMEDISDRKRAAEAKYRRLFESAKDGIVIIEGDTGEITDVNPYLLSVTGFERAELVGKTLWETEPFREMVDAKARERLRKREIVRLPDIPLKAKDQRRIDVEVVANMYEEGSRSVAQFNLRDITGRKQFDQQMQQTARLESLGILAGGIAHDFNNLLAGILGNAGLALSDAPPDSDYQSALRDIVHASQRASDLTSQMLAYAGKGRIVVRQTDLSETVNDISALIRSSIPKSVELSLDLAKGLPRVQADSGQMQQVIMNLIINGAEAIDGGGRVQVRTREEVLTADEIRGGFASHDLRPGIFVTVEVTDNGRGMDAKTQQRIFDPFFTTKFTGRGLGLASVLGIIKGHQGAIRISSSLGEGSTFKVWLPATERIELKPSISNPSETSRGAGEVILVVDDEEIVVRTAKAILQRNGYAVLSATNGQQAVNLVGERGNEIDLIILDLTMPVMGGAEALTRIQAIAPDVPVIISSGYDASTANSEFEGQNVIGFIHKPTPVPEFLLAVRNALQEAKAKNNEAKLSTKQDEQSN